MTKTSPTKGRKPGRSETKTSVTDTTSPPAVQSIVSNVTTPDVHSIVSIEDMHAVYEEKLKQLEEKLKNVELSLKSEIKTLYNIIKQKDDVIGNLNIQIGELKRSCDYLTKETADLKSSQENATKTIETKIESTAKFIHEVKSKTVDLEDRSRPENLVFFNFTEVPDETPEKCEQYIKDLIYKLNILPHDEELYIDRAHRLGHKNPECINKPRPIIAKFAYFKQKQEIIRNGHKFKTCPINVSEDYSRETIKEHKLLREHAKNAVEVFNDPIKALVSYKITYRRLLVTYSTNKNKQDAKKNCEGVQFRIH